MKILTAAAFIALAVCAEEAVPLEKFIRRDVPDAVLEDRFLPKKLESVKPRLIDRTSQVNSQIEAVLKANDVKIRRLPDGIFIIEPKGTEAEEDARASRLLKKRASIKISETTLDDAIDFIRRTTDIEIDFDTSVTDEDKKWIVKHDAFIENPETVGDVITKIGAYADLKWEVRDGRVVFSQMTQVKSGKEVKQHK